MAESFGCASAHVSLTFRSRFARVSLTFCSRVSPARADRIRFFECSAKTGDSVYDAFVNLASDQLEEKARRAEGGGGTVDVGGDGGGEEKGGCC